MTGVERMDGQPRSVIVVGAGIVGLSTAWFLQERGVDVTVVDRGGAGAGASGCNAGWIAPGLVLPLNSPRVLRYGLRCLFDSSAPLHVALATAPRSGRFLTQFAGNSRRAPWQRALTANVRLNEDCLEAFDVLVNNGVEVPVSHAPITAVFESSAEAQRLSRELDELEKVGQAMYVTALSGAALREQVPLAAPTATAGLVINGQRFVDPGRFVAALGRAVIDRGATLRQLEVDAVVSAGHGVAVRPRRSEVLIADAAVIATGAELPRLASRWLRVPVGAGRGYSFTVPVERPMPGPIYLPEARVACTPYRGALRVSGTMDFCDPRQPVAPERVAAIVASASRLLEGVRWDDRSDVWFGARPVTPDGRPLIGQVAPQLYVAGGHGMWGLTQGPVTGRLLAEQITTGKQPQYLREFDPLRKTGH
ncbi:amino acid dehydrogenase [Mycobacterium intermedium]|uniref:Amino acid dehydrogenase n=1 Tax=Mycobacterium intermedium TaxID=28445 RepID=A0A1E3SHR8_MYCIE|nr:FAD-dependent oxidoreductase [Mycobacterium intermedium]MCV6964924.1 FAD-binding oxidoreductase [Mycobacterium intermedium]ODR01690.1 amino acid dehydrogenase [Mycobacterium intermedium]OPE52211.1 amino acid dehydrogenase [Mycobacterium intermedium]ORA98830.1 amino acid dehydrogenase [Mycobacterium intermedium]